MYILTRVVLGLGLGEMWLVGSVKFAGARGVSTSKSGLGTADVEDLVASA